MQSLRGWARSRSVRCALWVALCFTLVSAAYLSWLYRLVAVVGSGAADWLSMVAGYLLQAAGIGAASLWLRRRPGEDFRRAFIPAVWVFAACAAPALLSAAPAGVIAFGCLMNLACGVISGFYLYAIGRRVGPDHRSRVFGGGYGIATVAVGLLALIGRGGLLRSAASLPLHLALAAAAALVTGRMDFAPPGAAPGDEAQPMDEALPAPAAPAEGRAPSGKDLALACGVVGLISLVKNLGFCFPSTDIQAGLVPELSRIPYAAGLIAAGFINDRNRRHGMACTVAALALPFIMLAMTREPVPTAICWGLDYLFYGFFSVFRAALFMDIADRARRPELAPLGLLLGRVGDAAGTGIGLMLAGSRLALIAATALLFIPAVLLFFRLYQRLYEPEIVRQRSEQEVFEAFCLRNDLSAREREVLRMVLDSRSNGEIAEALFIAESTVKYHVRNVLQKTGCKNRAELQRKYTLALYPSLPELP